MTTASQEQTDIDAGLTKPLVVDIRLDSYKTFFDHSWSERMFGLTAGSSIEAPVFDLCPRCGVRLRTRILCRGC